MKKRPVGRPTKYRPEYCEMLIEHMTDGSSMTSFAAEIGVSRETISEWGRVHPEFSASIKIGKAKCAAWWERIARSGANGGDVNPTLVIFGLKNMAADDWRDRREVDHSSKDGSMTPKAAIDATQLSDESLSEIMALRNAKRK